MRTSLGLIGLTALAWLSARDVRAAEPDAWLRWRAPADCPRAAEVEARVATLLGGSASAAAELRVVGEVRRDGQRWVLRLVARRGGGAQRRTLYHEDCAVLGEAAALLVALAVDPGAVVIDSRIASLLRRPAPIVRPSARESAPSVAKPSITTPGPTDGPLAVAPTDTPSIPVPPATDPSGSPAPPTSDPIPSDPAPPTSDPIPSDPSALPSPPTSVPPPAPPATPPASPRSSTQPRSMLWPALRLAGGINTGATPGVSATIGGAAALGIGRFARVELLGNYATPTRTRLTGTPTAGATVSLTSGGIRGCGVPGRSIVEIPLCLGVELGSMRATGFGVDDSRTTRSLWAALDLGTGLVIVPTPRLALWLGLDGQLALVRPSFLIINGGEVWRSGPLGLRAWLGVEVRLGMPRRPAA